MDVIKIGAAIKMLRIRAGYTQKEIAECLHVTDKAVSKWERGLSLPDITLITQLSIILNCDVDQLLGIFSGTEIYDKPLVYYFLCYFMLAGINRIYITCSESDCRYLEHKIGNGLSFGINLKYLSQDDMIPPADRDTMVVYDNPFLYGPNLTKYFHRAMSRKNGISVLTISEVGSPSFIMCSSNQERSVQRPEKNENRQYCVPITFFPKGYCLHLKDYRNIWNLDPLYVEPMGNGMICYPVLDSDAVLDTACFVRYLSTRMGKMIYSPEEIAYKRGFIG